MPNARAVAVIVAALSSCSAAVRAAEPGNAEAGRAAARTSLPEPGAALLLAAGIAGLALLGTKPGR